MMIGQVGWEKIGLIRALKHLVVLLSYLLTLSIDFMFCFEKYSNNECLSARIVTLAELDWAELG